MSQCKKIWNEVESRLFEKLTLKPLNGEGKYVHGKLKMWKKPTKTNFHCQDVPYDMYCNAAAVLKIDSTNMVKIIIFRYMLKSINTLMQKTDNATC